MAPKVSVNICCYNSEKFIKETIESVLAQTFGNLEVVIIDDGSKDATGEIIKSYQDERIKYFYQDNRGLAAARNRAIAESTGEYLALLDHDDLWETEKLKEQVALLESDPGIGLVFSDAYIVDANNKEIGRFFDLHAPHRGRVVDQLIRDNFIPCLTAVMRKNRLSAAGEFRTDLALAEEYDYFLRFSLLTDFDYVARPLARYRLHPDNASKDLEKMYDEEVECLKAIGRSPVNLLTKAAVIKQLAKKRIAHLLVSINLIRSRGLPA